MPSPRAVIFDMDGLMLDTETISMQSMKKTCQQFGLKVEEQWFFDIIGMNKDGCHAYFEQRLGHPLPDNLDEIFIKTYSDHVFTKGVDLKPGLLDLLGYLVDNNIPRAVATSSRVEMAHKKLKQTGIFDHFNHIVCGDQVQNGKPAPDIYLKAASLLEIETANCLALEDSDNGAKSAHAAGIDVIVIPDLKAPSDHTKTIAHKIVSDLGDVITYFENFA